VTLSRSLALLLQLLRMLLLLLLLLLLPRGCAALALCGAVAAVLWGLAALPLLVLLLLRGLTPRQHEHPGPQATPARSSSRSCLPLGLLLAPPLLHASMSQAKWGNRHLP